jgi:hypothetical protein
MSARVKLQERKQKAKAKALGAASFTNKSDATSMALTAAAPDPVCGDVACAAGELAACGAANADCAIASGTCPPPPPNREPHMLCGGYSVGFCNAARTGELNVPCECGDAYAGADCSECAGGFHAVPYPAWGPGGQRCERVPTDLAALVVPAAAASVDTGTPVATSDRGSDSDGGLSGGGIAGIVLACIVAASAFIILGVLYVARGRKYRDAQKAPAGADGAQDRELAGGGVAVAGGAAGAADDEGAESLPAASAGIAHAAASAAADAPVATGGAAARGAPAALDLGLDTTIVTATGAPGDGDGDGGPVDMHFVVSDSPIYQDIDGDQEGAAEGPHGITGSDYVVNESPVFDDCTAAFDEDGIDVDIELRMPGQPMPSTGRRI